MGSQEQHVVHASTVNSRSSSRTHPTRLPSSADTRGGRGRGLQLLNSSYLSPKTFLPRNKTNEKKSAHRYVVVRVTETVHGRRASHESDQGTVHRPREAEVLDQLAVEAGAEEARRGNNDELGDVGDIEPGLLDGAAGNVGNEGYGLLLELVQPSVHGHLGGGDGNDNGIMTAQQKQVNKKQKTLCCGFSLARPSFSLGLRTWNAKYVPGIYHSMHDFLFRFFSETKRKKQRCRIILGISGVGASYEHLTGTATQKQKCSGLFPTEQ